MGYWNHPKAFVFEQKVQLSGTSHSASYFSLTFLTAAPFQKAQSVTQRPLRIHMHTEYTQTQRSENTQCIEMCTLILIHRSSWVFLILKQVWLHLPLPLSISLSLALFPSLSPLGFQTWPLWIKSVRHLKYVLSRQLSLSPDRKRVKNKNKILHGLLSGSYKETYNP